MTAVQPARAGLKSEPGDLPGSRRARGRAPRPEPDTPPRLYVPEPEPARTAELRRAQLRALFRAQLRAQLRARARARGRDDVRPDRSGGRNRTPPVAA